MLRVADGGGNLGKLLDGVANLLVEIPAVGDDKYRIKNGGAFPLQSNKLVGEPGNRVTLATAGGVLNQIARAHTLRARS